MKDDPEDICSRFHLGAEIFDAMRLNGLETTHMDGTKEQIFALNMGAGKRVLVYSSVVGMEARAAGYDSIKVCATWTDPEGNVRGIGKERRVHRTGLISAIIGRVLQRVDAVKELCKAVETCPDCGAPKGVSKKGNKYCLAVCWKRDANGKLPPEPQFPCRPRYSGRRRWSRRW